MPDSFWSLDSGELARRLKSRPSGLSSEEAASRLSRVGRGEIVPRHPLTRTRLLLRQVRSPLLLLLVFAATISLFAREWSDAGIVLFIVLATIAIGFSREYSAHKALSVLASRVRLTATVLRDGRRVEVPREEVVPGDVVLLSPGSLAPADGLLLEAADLFVTESPLTGESFPVLKTPGVVAAGAPLAQRTNTVFLGTSVRSGTGRYLVAETGVRTVFGGIARGLEQEAPETDFDRGIRRFGYLLTSAMLVIVVLVFAAHVFAGRSPVETLLFSIALAVGLSPELLPAILSINLARGAQLMARGGVLVRHLSAIENLGSMDVLCTDKTGTLTEGVVSLEGAYDVSGRPSALVLERAAWNAALQTGLSNPLDEAIVAAAHPSLEGIRKLGEIPFDFVRKRVAVVLETSGGETLLISKGASTGMLEACASVLDPALQSQLEERIRNWNREGVRVLAVAVRAIENRDRYTREDEEGLSLLGFLTFVDRVKADAAAAVASLGRLGVGIKIVTGDSVLVAEHAARLVGVPVGSSLTGSQIAELDGIALAQAVTRTAIFAEVDPNQKERLIVALRRSGHVVGFLGDGVNDAPAMHAADTSLSVEGAVDVARQAADFVLLERDLDVIRGGIEEGRRTFANTLKYILTTTSANLGNMISMAGASLVLPFLPLTAGQILLNNVLSDVPAIGIADDAVDPELIERPPRWDVRFIGRFMVQFGLLSSIFDVLTFVVLLRLFGGGVALFRTGWFVESLLTELAIALVVRTRRPLFRSRPGGVLLWTTVAMTAVAFAIPYGPIAGALGFVPLPPALLGVMVAITAAYVAAAETAKGFFYRPRTAFPAPTAE